MSSLTDILTAAKNIVTAVNNIAQTYLGVVGSNSAAGITTTTVVSTMQGRLATVVVVTAGSAAGVVYDAASASVTTRPLFTIPMTTGVYVVNLPTNYGITVSPGTGQVVSVSYS